jgi:hypothetical protein
MGHVVAAKRLNLPAAESAEAATAPSGHASGSNGAKAAASRQAIERPPSARGLLRDLPLADADESPERERGDEVE